MPNEHPNSCQESGDAASTRPAPSSSIAPNSNLKPKANKMRRLLVLVAFTYLGIIAMLMFFESKLIYPAPKLQADEATQFGAEDVSFQSSDGTRLHGWYFENASAKKTIVFFHGNAECVATSGGWLGAFAKQLNVNAMIFDYRGYGQSEGTPHQTGIVADGKAAVEWTANRAGCDTSDLVFLGRSIGGGIAIQVAAENPPSAMVLVSTFSSLVDFAVSKFWWLPIRTVMRNRYDSVSVVSKKDIPMLQIHGDRDGLIPIKLARKLFDRASTTDKTWKVAGGHGHNGIQLESYIEDIEQLLE